MTVDEALSYVRNTTGASPTCAGRAVQTDERAALALANEVERLQAVVADQSLTIGTLRDELERERVRLAECGVAASGYFDGCAPEYESASLYDTVRLYAEKERLRKQVEGFEMERDHAQHILSEARKLMERKTAELQEQNERLARERDVYANELKRHVPKPGATL